jgi:hypothetical protein
MGRPGLVLPADVRLVVILADADGRDQLAGRCLVERACRRWAAEGRRVRLAWPGIGQDFNDMIRTHELRGKL